MKKLLFIALLFCLPAFGQVTVSPFVSSGVQFLNNSGQPLASGKVCFFAAGSTTPQTAYSDNLGTVPLSNPAVLDSAGRANIFLTAQSYKIVIAASTASSQCVPALSTSDNVSWATMANTVTSLVDTGALTVQASAAATSGANQSSPLLCVQGNYWTGAASASDKWCLQDLLGTGSNPTTTLNVTHGAGSSGTAAVSLPALSALTVTGASTLSSLNNVQYAALTTGDCGIGAAYAALPATGGRVQLVSDCTVSAAQTLTLTAGKPLDLDLAGRTITCTNSTGTVCLTILQTSGALRYQFELKNGTVTYSGAGTGITGIQAGNSGNCATGCVNTDRFAGLAFTNFNTSGSTAVSLSNVQDTHWETVLFQNNTVGLALNLSTIQNQFSNISFQGNTTAIIATDAAEITFLDCLVQSNTGTKPVQIVASTISVTNVRFKHCHFENNGDATANGRQIALQAAGGKTIASVTVEQTVFNSGANVNAGSFIFDLSGGGTVTYVKTDSNHYFTGTNFYSGFTGDSAITAVNDNAGANSDVAINSSNMPAGCINGGTGLALSPIGATVTYQMHGGSPAFNNGSFIIRDCTNSLNILDYHSSTFQFLRQIVLTGSTGSNANLVFTEEAAPSGGASQAWLYADSTKHALMASYNNDAFAPVVRKSQTLQVAGSNFTTSSATLVAVTGLTFTTPASTASNWSFRCDLIYSQATAAAANLWGIITSGTAPTQLQVAAEIFTNNTGTQVDNNALITTATSTTVATATPSAFGAIGTNADMFNAHIYGTIEAPSNASPSVFAIGVATGNVSDALTIYRGGSCWVY